jgi:mannose-6-phosphate isomerase-like protein (cupin superfamily)
LDGSDNSGFKVKRIEVLPGKRLSLQSHEFRSEHWVISKGNAKAIVGEQEYFLNTNDYIYIPTKTVHRIENIGTDMLEFIETQIGNYLGEDDIVRYHEDF